MNECGTLVEWYWCFEKNCLSNTLSNINPMWTVLGLNPGLRSARPATDRLRDGTVPYTSACSQYLGCPSTLSQFVAVIGSWELKSANLRFSVASRTSCTQIQNSTLDLLTILARFYCWLDIRKICCWQQKCTNVGRLLQVATKFYTYLLTQWNTVFPWEANRFSANQKFPAFYGTRMFINAFTNAHHLSLSCARSIQSMPPPNQLPEDRS